jgi:hypothetical protein
LIAVEVGTVVVTGLTVLSGDFLSRDFFSSAQASVEEPASKMALALLRKWRLSMEMLLMWG